MLLLSWLYRSTNYWKHTLAYFTRDYKQEAHLPFVCLGVRTRQIQHFFLLQRTLASASLRQRSHTPPIRFVTLILQVLHTLLGIALCLILYTPWLIWARLLHCGFAHCFFLWFHLLVDVASFLFLLVFHPKGTTDCVGYAVKSIAPHHFISQ